MLTFQQDFIYKNQDRLINCMVVNDEVINYLYQRNTLLDSDMAHFENVQPKGNEALAQQLLKILTVRDGGFEKLQDVLCQYNQIKPLKILQEINNNALIDDQELVSTSKKNPSFDSLAQWGHSLPRQRSSRQSFRTRLSQLKSWCGPLGNCFESFVCCGTYNRFTNENKNLECDNGLRSSFEILNTNISYYYDHNSVLGTGNTSTVFLGFLDGNPDHKVAIKFVNKNVFKVKKPETQMALEIFLNRGEHTNYIVPVLSWHIRNDRYYIVMELASTTLDKAIKDNLYNLKHDKKKLIGLFENCVDAVHWLHTNQNIIHRDIKPENIMLFEYDSKLVAKLGDFGCCRRLMDKSGALSSGGKEVDIWMAPETVIAKQNEDSRFVNKLSMDIFSLGMILHYSRSGGEHPFGNVDQIYTNIVDINFSVPQLPVLDFWDANANDITQWMLLGNPEHRPTIDQVKNHPVFWDDLKCLRFIEDISDALHRKEKGSPLLKVRENLDEDFRQLYKQRKSVDFWWEKMVEASLFQREGKGKKYYEYESIISLVELIRDKAVHYQDQTKKAKNVLFLGKPYNRKDYVLHFLSTFPYFVIYLFKWFSKTVNEHEELATLQEEYFSLFSDSRYAQSNYSIL